MVLANVVQSNKGVIHSTYVDIDGTTEIKIDGGGVSIDGTNDSNLTVTGSAKDLDIAVAGGSTQELRIASAGTGTNALSIDATAGSMVIGPTLANGQTLKLGPNGATEMIFTPHGTPANEKISLTNTAGDANDAIKLLSTAGGVTIDGGNGTIQFADNGASLGTITSSGYSGDAAGLSGLTATASELNILDESSASSSALSTPQTADGVLTYDASANTISWKTLASVCFLKGTKITLPDKSQKNIEDLCVGEMILTYQIKGLSNLKKDQKHEIMDWSQDSMEGIFRQNKVKNIWVNPTDRYLVINDKLRVTNLHIIHVKRDDEYKFLPAEKAQLGDKLFTDQGEYESITDIKEVREKTEVYNIEVKKNKTYFAENYLVHHLCETCSGLSGRI
jgi:hypothetical protein